MALTTSVDLGTSPLGAPLDPVIDELWERRDDIREGDDSQPLVRAAIDLLDTGRARVAAIDPATDEVVVNERAKRAILLGFRVLTMFEQKVGDFHYHDRLPLKSTFDGVRVVPGAIARWGSFVAPGAILMPSYVNIGGHVGPATMVDTWATVGSCAQVGARVHLSGGVGLGGVLEPPNARPVVVEDDALIGSRAMITDGARVGEGAVVGAGVILNPSIPVIDAETGEEVSRGQVPAWSVAVSGTRFRQFPGGTFGLPCVLVIKRLPEGERHDKAQVNAVLRGHGVSV